MESSASRLVSSASERLSRRDFTDSTGWSRCVHVAKKTCTYEKQNIIIREDD